MDYIHSLTPVPDRFTQTYVFERLLALPPLNERTAIVLFRNKQTDELVVVRFVPADDAHEYEIRIIHQVENMRRALQLPTIISLHGYMTCEDPFKTYPLVQKKPAAGKSPYYGILMDHVSLKHTDLNADVMTLNGVIDCTIELLYTLWVARRDFQFYHGDLHIGNIMFRENTELRNYVVNGYEFTVSCEYMPVIIDFEKSIFGQSDNKKEKLSDVRLVMGAMYDLLTHFGHDETREFEEVYNWTLNDEFTRTDSRFRPETIAEILTQRDLFDASREPIMEEEPELKRAKDCIQCNARVYNVECSSCGAQFCSAVCAQKAWLEARDSESCH